MNVDQAARELRRMYDRGKRLQEVSQHLHLFGIIYADELRPETLPIGDVIKLAGVPAYTRTEIHKGRKLAKYVQLKHGVEI